MPYVTIAQLQQRLGAALYARLTDRDQGTTADDAVAQQIVDEASAEADSYLCRRYATPVDLAAHPELASMLTLRALDLAEAFAWRSSPFITDPPQRVQALARQAYAWLEEIARGHLALPAAHPPAAARATEDGPRYTGSPRQFTADELDGL